MKRQGSMQFEEMINTIKFAQKTTTSLNLFCKPISTFSSNFEVQPHTKIPYCNLGLMYIVEFLQFFYFETYASIRSNQPVWI